MSFFTGWIVSNIVQSPLFRDHTISRKEVPVQLDYGLERGTRSIGLQKLQKVTEVFRDHSISRKVGGLTVYLDYGLLWVTGGKTCVPLISSSFWERTCALLTRLSLQESWKLRGWDGYSIIDFQCLF